jgi:hypothetical protein
MMNRERREEREMKKRGKPTAKKKRRQTKQNEPISCEEPQKYGKK